MCVGEGDVLAFAVVVGGVPGFGVGGVGGGVEDAFGFAGVLLGGGIGGDGGCGVVGFSPPVAGGAVGFPGVGEGIGELGVGLEVVVVTM